MLYSDEQIARAVHLMNGLLQEFHGEQEHQPCWRDAPDAMRGRVLALVRGYKAGMTPRQAHERWMESMAGGGWRYGPRKDPAGRTHPAMVAYSALPQEQRVKDLMSQQITMVLATAGGEQ